MSEATSPGRAADRGSQSRRLVAAILGRLEHGQLEVIEGSRLERFGVREEGGMQASMTINDPAVWNAMLLRGGVGLGEAYFEGWWDSQDPVAVLRLLALNLERINSVTAPIAALRRSVAAPSRWLRRPSKTLDRRNVGAHYDLGNDFFKLFLDPTMAYSSGVYESDASTLHEASIAKFDRICRKLELGPGDHVLEIGSGWGGFAVHAATRYGCRVTTTTISQRQYEHCVRLVADAGLTNLVTVLSQDYRDVTGQYSHLVSIEMIEAVDWRDVEGFFATCAHLLSPGGRMALQCIVIADREQERYRTGMDYIQRYIFPGGSLPSITSLATAVMRSGNLRLTDLEDIGFHYARTLSEWRQHLRARWEDARHLGLDDRFLRMWDFYFAYCEAGFLERRISTIQVVLAAPGWRSAPVVRTV